MFLKEQENSHNKKKNKDDSNDKQIKRTKEERETKREIIRQGRLDKHLKQGFTCDSHLR